MRLDVSRQVKVDVFKEAYKQDSVIGEIVRKIVNRSGENLLTDYIKGKHVYLSEIMSNNNYKAKMEAMHKEVIESLQSSSTYQDIFNDSRIDNKLEYILHNDNKPYIVDFFNQLRIIERKINSQAINGYSFSYMVNDIPIKGTRTRGYFSSYFYLLATGTLDPAWDREFYDVLNIPVSDEILESMREMIKRRFTPEFSKDLAEVKTGVLEFLNRFIQERTTYSKYLVREVEGLAKDNEVNFGDLASTVLSVYVMGWQDIKRELKMRGRTKDTLVMRFNIEDLEQIFADRDYRGLYNLVRKTYIDQELDLKRDEREKRNTGIRIEKAEEIYTEGNELSGMEPVQKKPQAEDIWDEQREKENIKKDIWGI